MSNLFGRGHRNVVDFIHHHPRLGDIRYKGEYVFLNDDSEIKYLGVKIFERDGKPSVNTQTKKDIPAISKFFLVNIEFNDFYNGNQEIGLRIVQAIHDAKKSQAERELSVSA